MSLPRFALKYRTIVASVVMLTMTLGILAFFTMPRREDPEFTIRTCLILTQWPGATPQKVEELITDPLETAIDSLDEVDFITSRSLTGLSVLYVNAEESINPDRIDNVWDKVRAKVRGVTPLLPQGAYEPQVNADFGDTAVMLLAVYERPPEGPDGRPVDPRYTLRQLEVFAERVKDELKLLPDVARAELHGVRSEAIYLETDLGQWTRLGLTMDELRGLLQARNIVAPGGTIDTDLGRFAVQPSGELDAVRQIDEVIVDTTRQGIPVYLRDLGINVVRDYEDPPSVITRYVDPEISAPCVLVSFTMKAGGSITRLGDVVRQRLAELKEADRILPPDIEIGVIADQPTTVNRKINDFVGNVAQAIILVILVAYLIIGGRIALVMAASIPVVVLSSIGIVRMFGVDLEQVSIASLIIALGMLVDNAIEVSEQSHRLQHEGLSRFQAAVRGTEQVMFPILVATLTTMAAFLPMLIALEGSTREYVWSLPVTVATTLAISWLCAVTFVTLLAYWLVRPATRKGGSTSPVLRLFSLLRPARKPEKRSSDSDGRPGGYVRLCRFALRHKWAVAFVALLAFVGALALPVGTEFFPSDLRDQFALDIWLPNGVGIAQTDEVSRRAERILQALSPLRDERGEFVLDDAGRPVQRLAALRSSVGGGGARWYLSINPEQTQSCYAQICVRTTDPRLTNAYVADVRRAIAEGVPPLGLAPIAGARVIARPLDLGPPVDSPIGLRIYGPGFADLRTLRSLADRMQDILRSQLGTWDVHDTWGSTGYELAVEVDEARANLAGVTNAAVAQTLNAFFSGHYLTTFREGDHTVPVYLRLPREQRASLDQVAAVFVEGQNGKVPIDAVATIEPRWQVARIDRRDLNRMIEVRARVDEGLVANEILANVLGSPEYAALEASLPGGYFIEVAGIQEETTESRADMTRSFGISLLLILLCLIAQYNSLAKPVIILVTVPLAFIGSLLGLYLSGNSLGFMPQLGLLSLAGIVLNAAIVYVEFAETLIRDRLSDGRGVAEPGARACAGLTPDAFHECLARAGKMRILPISLTTLTTIGGLVPLALFGGPLWEGMALVLIFGLAIATVMTLLVLPAVYAIFVQHLGLTVRPEPTETTEAFM